MTALLELDNIRASYGHFQALFDLSLTVNEGEIVTLIGANGAGKTTTLRVISGVLRPTQGTMRFGGEDISRLPSHRMPERGISHVPEGRQLFPFMSVEENLDLGAYNRRSRGDAKHKMAEMFEIFPRLAERRRQLAGTLSGGEQQMVAIARGLMARPRLLMIDEPFLGLAPLVVEQIGGLMRRIRDEQGIGIAFIEQNVELALRLADRGYVLESGRTILSGPSAELLRSDEVKRIFLGDVAL